MTRLPTIKIKGRDYIQVKDRVFAFNEAYPNGSIRTEIVSSDEKNITVKATIMPDVSKPERYFTGYSHETIGSSDVNRTSALENCETSAVGRALAFMGIGIIESIASADEVKKAVYEPPKVASPASYQKPFDPPTKAQTDLLQHLLKEYGVEKVTDLIPDADPEALKSKIKMNNLIDDILAIPKPAKAKVPSGAEEISAEDIPA